MSWAEFVENKIINFTTDEGHKFMNACKDGGIYGLDGTKWSTSSGLTLSENEVKALVSFFTNHSAVSLCLGGNKYQVTCDNKDTNSVYLKIGGGGACVAKTNKAIIVGIYDTTKTTTIDNKEKSQNVGYCNSAVENLQQYLIGIGY